MIGNDSQNPTGFKNLSGLFLYILYVSTACPAERPEVSESGEAFFAFGILRFEFQ